MSLGTQRYAMQVAGRVRDDNRRQLTRQRYTSDSFFSVIYSLLTQQDCLSKWLRIKIQIALPLPELYVFGYWKHCVLNVSCHVRPDFSSEFLVSNFCLDDGVVEELVFSPYSYPLKWNDRIA